jgi:two-component system cell cycle sensor histidine kinase/response regulator CckA
MTIARILIVEDELLIVEDLKSRLLRLGHTIAGHATTAELAVQKAVETKPELVLMDIRLRGNMNGLEAAARIRQAHPVPIVYVTAHAAAVAEHAIEQEQRFVLTKPFSTMQLKAAITAALR